MRVSRPADPAPNAARLKRLMRLLTRSDIERLSGSNPRLVGLCLTSTKPYEVADLSSSTLLHELCSLGMAAATEALCTEDPLRVLVPDALGRTPVHLAVLGGDRHCLRVACHAASVALDTPRIPSILEFAVSHYMHEGTEWSERAVWEIASGGYWSEECGLAVMAFCHVSGSWTLMYQFGDSLGEDM